MNIKIQQIADSKILDKERIIFEVLENDFLGAYLVLKSKQIGEKTVSNKTEGTYWFPDKNVSKGDLVVLYTKSGVNTERKNNDGTTTHFFYWFIDEAIWNSPEDTVILIATQEWNYKTVSNKEKDEKEAGSKT